MEFRKQVDKCHYQFGRYLSKARWSSVWHQVDEVIKLAPENVLEIGPGPGLFKQVCRLFDMPVETLDLDPELKPDYVGSATSLPFKDKTYDAVCAFQILEHLPYEIALQAFKEMTRVSKGNIVISLPDARTMWRYQFHIPKFGSYNFLIPKPRLSGAVHEFDGEHYWEINKKGYKLDKIIRDFSKYAQLVNTYVVFENPYHRFLIFKI